MEFVVDDVDLGTAKTAHDIEGKVVSFFVDVLHFYGDNIRRGHEDGKISAFRRGKAAHVAIPFEQGRSFHFDLFLLFVVGHQWQDRIDALGLKIDIKFLVERVGAQSRIGCIFQQLFQITVGLVLFLHRFHHFEHFFGAALYDHVIGEEPIGRRQMVHVAGGGDAPLRQFLGKEDILDLTGAQRIGGTVVHGGYGTFQQLIFFGKDQEAAVFAFAFGGGDAEEHFFFILRGFGTGVDNDGGIFKDLLVKATAEKKKGTADKKDGEAF